MQRAPHIYFTTQAMSVQHISPGKPPGYSFQAEEIFLAKTHNDMLTIFTLHLFKVLSGPCSRNGRG